MAARPRITTAERRARLSVRHRLVPSARVDDDIAAIASSVVALHSSDPASVYLSAMARMKHPSVDAVAGALYDDRVVVRHHAMRRTLWVFTPEIARWAHGACTAALAPVEWRRLAKLIEESDVSTDGAAWVADARTHTLDAVRQAGAATTRRLGELVPALKAPLYFAVGKPYAGRQGAHTRVLLNLGFDGLIVRGRSSGAWTTSEYAWSLMDGWVPGGVLGVDATVASNELARAYLAAFGPATTADVQWWAGWTLGTTRAALAAIGAVVVDTDDGEAWVNADDVALATNNATSSPGAIEKPAPWVTFLPALDPTVMGWKDRWWYFGEHGALGQSLLDRNGNAGPTIWMDGRVVGGWAQRKDGEIAYEVLEDVGKARLRDVERAAGAVRAHIGTARVNARFPAPIQKRLLA